MTQIKKQVKNIIEKRVITNKDVLRNKRKSAILCHVQSHQIQYNTIQYNTIKYHRIACNIMKRFMIKYVLG